VGCFGFNVDNDKIRELAMYAQFPIFTIGIMTLKLFTYGLRVLVALCRVKHKTLSRVIIWELQRDYVGPNPDSSFWKEMKRMPLSVTKEFKELLGRRCFDWMGPDDFLYIKWMF
jgi:hypothetical protein